MSKQEKGYSRRKMLGLSVGIGGLALTGGGRSILAAVSSTKKPARMLTIDAKPAPIAIDPVKTALIVVDMQNDFGANGGMFHRAGIDISMIKAAVAPTAKAVSAARKEGIKIVYLKMGFKPDLSDAGASDSVNLTRHLNIMKVGTTVKAPNGANSRILIRDTWNTDILSELNPEPNDIVLYKNRFSGFYQTELDTTLKRLGIKHLIFTGCTTSVCVESTIRDAMYRDYLPVLLADCTGEPIGYGLSRSNHEASLLTIQVLFGWISSSSDFIKGLESSPSTKTGHG